MSRSENLKRANQYHEHATKILFSWNGFLAESTFVDGSDFKKPTEITQEQIEEFENLVFTYFKDYYSNYKFNAFTKSRYERSKIGMVIVNYCLNIKKGRWKEIEPYLINDNLFVIDYVSHIIKGRMPEYEEILEAEKNISAKRIYAYSIACKSKVPEKLHNIMLAYAITGNRYAKNYLTNCESPKNKDLWNSKDRRLWYGNNNKI